MEDALHHLHCRVRFVEMQRFGLYLVFISKHTDPVLNCQERSECG